MTSDCGPRRSIGLADARRRKPEESGEPSATAALAVAGLPDLLPVLGPSALATPLHRFTAPGVRAVPAAVLLGRTQAPRLESSGADRRHGGGSASSSCVRTPARASSSSTPPRSAPVSAHVGVPSPDSEALGIVIVVGLTHPEPSFLPDSLPRAGRFDRHCHALRSRAGAGESSRTVVPGRGRARGADRRTRAHRTRPPRPRRPHPVAGGTQVGTRRQARGDRPATRPARDP